MVKVMYFFVPLLRTDVNRKLTYQPCSAESKDLNYV